MVFGRNPFSSPSLNSSNRVGGDNVKFPQLDHDAIESFIEQFSTKIKYFKAVQCPCFTPDSGQPNIKCNRCRGLGWFYGEAENKEEYLKAQVHSRRSNKQSDKGGLLTTGYSSVTLLPGVIPGDGDLIQVCKDREVVNDEYHIFGSKLMDGSTAERLRFRDVVCVEMVVIRDQSKNDSVILKPEEWYFDRDARMIRFNIEVAIGAQYSVRYIAIPEYIVLGNTSKPLLRVTHDDSLAEPARYEKDVIYPFNVLCVRLDRAILQKNRGQVDLEYESTFNKNNAPMKKGPFV